MNIGLFFGSFNPIHHGHLLIASQILEFSDLDKIWFVVSPQNPLKKKSTLLNEYDRLHLVELAIANDDRFKASNVEFALPKPSYSVDTLAHLKDKHPEHNFSLIMGGDNLGTLPKWKNYETILKYYQVYVYSRPGYDTDTLLAAHPHVHVLQFPQMDISASYIRKCVADGISIRYLVADAVREYILNMSLFQAK